MTEAPENDGLGFDLKWNMGLMNDYLTYIGYDPYFRGHHQNELTFSMIYQYSENFMTVFSHDEVVHGKSSMIGKMPGVKEDKFANLRLTYGYMMTHPGKKLLFMGQDIAEFQEFDETRQVQWNLLQYEEHKGVNRLVKDLNALYKMKPALYAKDTSPEGFEWINCISSEQCMVSFLRKTDKAEDTLLVVANFAGVEQVFKVGVPYDGKYKETLNTDDKIYGGGLKTLSRVKHAQEGETDGKPYSVTVTQPALSLSVYSYVPYTEKEKLEIAKKKEEKEAKESAKIAEEEARAFMEEAIKVQKAADEAMKKAKEAAKKAEIEKEKARKAEEALKK